MSRLNNLDRFDTLPEFGQALLAVRMVARAFLGKLPEHDAERHLILKACSAAEQCARDGRGTFYHKDLFREVMNLRDLFDLHRGNREWIRCSAWWMVDAINAAEAVQDFPIDGTATRSARQAFAALHQDRELNPMQITILLAGDLDQLHFACDEDRRLPAQNLSAKYEGLGPNVMGRLAPVHALTVTPYRATGEEAAR